MLVSGELTNSPLALSLSFPDTEILSISARVVPIGAKGPASAAFGPTDGCSSAASAHSNPISAVESKLIDSNYSNTSKRASKQLAHLSYDY